MNDYKEDPDFTALIECLDFPCITKIAALAKKYKIDNVGQFWDLFGVIQVERYQRKNYAADWDNP